jgi:hypothetical protein
MAHDKQLHIDEKASIHFVSLIIQIISAKYVAKETLSLTRLVMESDFLLPHALSLAARYSLLTLFARLLPSVLNIEAVKKCVEKEKRASRE